MGAIRERLLVELDLLGMSAATKKSYVGCCRVFVAYFKKSPEQMGEREIREFLLHLIRDRKAGPSSSDAADPTRRLLGLDDDADLHAVDPQPAPSWRDLFLALTGIDLLTCPTCGNRTIERRPLRSNDTRPPDTS